MAIAASRILVICLCFLILLLVVPVMIGIYVYRDASRRKMNALLWTLVAVITPVFVGLIIYLLVRGNYSDLVCPVCQQDVMKDYTVCPGCGARLRRVCEKCGYPVEEGWSVCPRCAAPLQYEEAEAVTPPVHKKDKGLWKILLAVVLIPVLLFIILLVNVSVSTSGSGSSSGRLASYTQDDMEQFREIKEVWIHLEEWEEEDADGVYVIKYQEWSSDGIQNAYLIYRPSAGNMKSVNQSKNKDRSGNNLLVSFEDTDDPDWNHAYYPLTYVSEKGGEPLGLEILVNGEPVDYELVQIYVDPLPELP